MIEKEFKINKYITLRLEHGQTNIYVNGQLFNQCKYLLLNLSKADFKTYEDIQSIDDAFKRYSRDHEANKTILDPETEFIGHCSNLQAWYENDYDVRILHSSLSLPLLKKLALIGDSKAKIVLKELIAQRLAQGNKNAMVYLFDESCLNIFEPEELEVILESCGYSIFELKAFMSRERDGVRIAREGRLREIESERQRTLAIQNNINQFGKDYIMEELGQGHKYVISYLNGEQLPVFTLEDLEELFEIIDIEDQALLRKINGLINRKRVINKLKQRGKTTINLEKRYKDVKRLYY